MRQENNRVQGNEEESLDVGDSGEKADTPEDWQSYGKSRLGRQMPWVLLALILLLIGAVLFWILYVKSTKKTPIPAKETPAASTLTAEASRPAAESSQKKMYEEIRVPLTASDDAVRQYAAGLTVNPLMDVSLKEKDLVRRFVAAVNNIARGESLRPLSEFLAPKESFSVIKKGNRLFLDPAGYRRYDSLVNFFNSMDEEKCSELYQRFRTLMDDAYAELGYKGGGFPEILVEAANRILEVPVQNGPIELYEKPLRIGYGYIDEKLESLSDAQKHFLRMGPDNLRRSKQKLHRLMDVLDLAKKLRY